MKSLLFACGGLGLGNASRLLGVAQALRRLAGPEAPRLTVFTSGPALALWRAEGAALGADVRAFEPFPTGAAAPGESLEWRRYLRPSFLTVYRRNQAALDAFLRPVPPDLALLDSDYHVLPLLLRRVPIWTLGQAQDVLRRCRRDRAWRGAAVELLDYAYQRAVSERVLVPCFEPDEVQGPRVARVPLIVREPFAAAPGLAPAPRPAYVLLSGSGIGAGPLGAYARERGLPVLSGGAPALDASGRPLIDEAAVVLTQGGLSSISECAARRKPMAVLPIPRHAEQARNAAEVERLGLGRAVRALDAEPAALAAAAAPRWPRTDGASVAAELLLRRLGAA